MTTRKWTQGYRIGERVEVNVGRVWYVGTITKKTTSGIPHVRTLVGTFAIDRKCDIRRPPGKRIVKRWPTFKTTLSGREVWFPYVEGSGVDTLQRKLWIAVVNAEDSGIQNSLRESGIIMEGYETEDGEDLVVVWPPERFGEPSPRGKGQLPIANTAFTIDRNSADGGS